MDKKKLKQAVEFHRQGDLDNALKLYLDLLTRSPTHTELLHAVGIIYAQQEHLHEAFDMLNQAIQFDKNNASLYNSLGNVLLKQKEFDAAIVAYKKAIKLKHNYAKAYNNLANCLYHQDKFAAADKAYQKAIQYNPGFADAHCNYGIALLKQNKIEAAKAELEQALTLQPNSLRALSQLGELFLKENNFQQAIQCFEKRLALHPPHAPTWHSLGVAYLQIKNPKKALTAFENSLRLNPNFGSLHHDMATAFLEVGDVDSALKHYFRQLELEPLPETYYNIGVLLMYRERNREATQYLQRALELDPTNIGAELNLGAIFLKANQFNEALKHYEAAQHLKPDDPEINYLIAAVSQQQPPTRAPNEYLQHLFNQYAGYYDKHLTECLKYQVPMKMHQMVMENCEMDKPRWIILDLGCGTGLCGEEFKQEARQLFGIDISAEMITIAKKKNMYTDLQVGELTELLPTFHKIDLITAADVFAYMGDLCEIFTATKECLKPGGLFCFSVEAGGSDDFKLQRNARYTHSKKYLERLIQETGFEVLQFDHLVLRQQHKQPVSGYLVLLRRTLFFQ